MVPPGRRSRKVPTLLATRADWVMAARRTASPGPVMRLALETWPVSLAELVAMALRCHTQRLILRHRSDPVTTAILAARWPLVGWPGRGV